MTPAVDPRAVAVELTELAPELSQASADVLVREVPNASGTGLAELGLLLATRGFDVIGRADLTELRQLIEEVYATLPPADNAWMGEYLRMLREGTLNAEGSARGRRLLTQGVQGLSEGRRLRLQALLEKAIRAGIESRHQAETRAQHAMLAPPPEVPAPGVPVVAPDPVAPSSTPGPIAPSVAGGGGSDARGEAYWRTRMQQARARVAQLKAEITRLDQIANREAYGPSLEPQCRAPQRITPESQAQFENCVRLQQNWPLRQRAEQEARVERLALLRQQLAASERAIGEIEDEARRAGALPGWLRD